MGGANPRRSSHGSSPSRIPATGTCPTTGTRARRKNPEVALKWANQIGDKKFRGVAKVSQRIKNRLTTPAKNPNLGSKAVSMRTSVHRPTIPDAPPSTPSFT